jgi:hypothetical protein
VLIKCNLVKSAMACTALVSACIVGTVAYQPAACFAAVKPPKPDKVHNGKVTAVDTTANTITIEHGKKAPHTFSVTKDTKITVEGASGKALSDVKTGMHAKVGTVKKATVALSIDATTKKLKKNKK